MRKLPSSKSASNLRQLVGSVAVANSAAVSTSTRSSAPTPSSGSPTTRSSSNVAMSSGRNMAQLGNVGSVTAMDSSEDRHGKQSQAYLHTKPHRQVQDKLGKNYERRSCNYCDVVFSFKGGTTSAALRHLKKAHLEKLSEDHPCDPEVSVTGRSSLSTTANNSQVAECPDEHAVASSPVSKGGSDDNRNENPTSVAVSSVNDQDEEDAPLVVETEAPTSKRDRSRTTSKRKRGNNDLSTIDCTVPSTYERVGGDRVDTVSSSSKLTASQTAIVHFLHHFANELPQPAMRLRLAKHLTHNVGEAEMYNVLDSATQLEYIREFARPSPR
ncbi:hypothetical protein PF005_g670 [Phytophthora fragariae]|uniref:BED-type domain-containing protein n=1 Tax=Phytophthora fragariae TaxID=53985 RepID=A0A6A3ZIK9_9STRA|nr:hypothetical protein PF009_g888 [Phytophthora fragariae]KAE9139500.1 hypothetical protein PF010_g558 [Phytophthora fragariae]KAE9140168.1 hypothetical protein PF007_g748 [Phytophthora fragariae]KAE9155574.1 hypothetical protein PF006_g484 [Phytophthora fragariae]KAE9237384.1 hypothetical protein PF005_g670 [Phytophthora fragariae]